MLFELAGKFLGLTPFFVLFPLVIYSLRWRHLGLTERLIGGYLIVSMLAGFLSYYLWVFGMENLWVLHIYLALELPFILLAFTSIPQMRKWRSLAIFFSALFTIFSLVNSMYIQPIDTFNSNGKIVESLIVSSICILALISISSGNLNTAITKLPMFWISSGILIYYSSSIFIFGLSNDILHRVRNLNLIIWSFHAMMVFLEYVLISIGFSKARRI